MPPPIVTALGGKGRIPVLATFDGIAYRGSIVSMGGPDKVIGILKSIRGELGKLSGDVVTVTLAVDESQRTLEIPGDLAQAVDRTCRA